MEAADAPLSRLRRRSRTEVALMLLIRDYVTVQVVTIDAHTFECFSMIV